MAIYKNTAELMGVIHSNLCDRMISQRLTFRTTLEKEDTGATIWIEKKGADQRKKAASDRVNSVKGRPANLRGDNTGGGKGKTEEDRLRGVQI